MGACRRTCPPWPGPPKPGPSAAAGTPAQAALWNFWREGDERWNFLEGDANVCVPFSSSPLYSLSRSVPVSRLPDARVDPPVYAVPFLLKGAAAAVLLRAMRWGEQKSKLLWLGTPKAKLFWCCAAQHRKDPRTLCVKRSPPLQRLTSGIVLPRHTTAWCRSEDAAAYTTMHRTLPSPFKSPFILFSLFRKKVGDSIGSIEKMQLERKRRASSSDSPQPQKPFLKQNRDVSLTPSLFLAATTEFSRAANQ